MIITSHDFRLLFAAVVVILSGLSGGSVHAEDRLQTAVESIRKADLATHVNFLASDTLEGREAGTRGGQAAVAYLASEMERIGLQPLGDGNSFIQEFDNGYRNVLGVIPGSDPQLKSEVILMGAHLDHVGYGTSNNSFGPIGRIHNGADDNASGVATLLEIAQAVTQLPQPLPRTVVFALWDGEEKGLLGSKHWIEHPTIPLASIKLVINADMVGRLSGNTAIVYGTRTSIGIRKHLIEANRTAGMRLDFDHFNREDSDHFPFFKKQIPYLMIFTGEHQDYHRPSDDPDRLNLDGIERIARVLFRVLVAQTEASALSGFYLPAPLQTSRGAPPLKPLPSRLGITWSPLPLEDGSLSIVKVDRESPAERSGLQPGDILTHMNGSPMGQLPDLRNLVRQAVVPFELRLLRGQNAERHTVTIIPKGLALPLGCNAGIDETDPDSVVLEQILSDSEASRLGFRLWDRIHAVHPMPTAEGEPDENPSPQWIVERDGLFLTLPAQTTNPVRSDVPAAR